MRPPQTMRMWTHRNQGDEDPFGGSAADWQPHVSDAPCYWGVTGGSEDSSEARNVTVSDEHILCPLGVDIVEGDRIVRVTDHTGAVVFDIANEVDVFREVDHVANLRDFADLTLKRAG